MKKLICLLVSLALMFSVISPSVISLASTEENYNSNSTINEIESGYKYDAEYGTEDEYEANYELDFETSDEDFTEELNEDFQDNLEEIAEESNIDNIDELNTEITEVTDNEITFETNLENDELSADMEVVMDTENDDINLSGKVIDAEGQSTEYDYKVEVTEIEGELFKATFTDTVTGETIEYDNSELTASAVPIVVYLIGAQAVKVAVKYVAKKAILKIGSRSFKQVSSKVAKSALKNFKSYTVKAGKYKITVSKGRMSHILENHHPRYWTGKKGKSMFDPDLSINDIKNIINTTIRKNASKIEKGIKNGDKVNAEAKVSGIKYRVVVTKDKTIQSAFPID